MEKIIVIRKDVKIDCTNAHIKKTITIDDHQSGKL